MDDEKFYFFEKSEFKRFDMKDKTMLMLEGRMYDGDGNAINKYKKVLLQISFETIKWHELMNSINKKIRE